jgi:hypothetical protein
MLVVSKSTVGPSPLPNHILLLLRLLPFAVAVGSAAATLVKAAGTNRCSCLLGCKRIGALPVYLYTLVSTRPVAIAISRMPKGRKMASTPMMARGSCGHSGSSQN